MKEKEACFIDNESKQVEEMMKNVVLGLTAENGHAFFETLIRSLVRSFKMEFAFIGELTGKGNQTVKTVSVYSQDKIISNFEFPLAHTPSERVVEKKQCFYFHEATKRFPDDPLLQQMGAESYLGVPLFDSGGHPIGLMVIMDRKPMMNIKRVESVVQIFAVRASIELERKRLEESIQWLEYRDPVTGLPNQLFFYDLLKNGVQQAKKNGESLALLLIDLNSFNKINHNLGLHRGDFLLQKVGRRLEDLLGYPNSVARIGGNEFGLILPKANAEQAKEMVSRVFNTLEEPFEIDGFPVCVDAAIGTALYPEEGSDPDNLFLRAEIVLYTSKASKPAYHVGTDTRKTAHVHGKFIQESVSLIKDLHQSVESGQLFLVYQPRVNISEKEVRGVEALIRWHHPKLGIVQPRQIISLAEKTDLMRPLTLFVLKEALNQCRLWHESGWNINISVNLARQNLLDPDLPDQIVKLLQTFSVNPAWLDIEITEGMLMSEREKISNSLVRLGRKGIGLSLDNFGFLSSSMDYLKKLPIHSIKIDRSYITDAMINLDHEVVVRSAIDFAHAQGLKVIAVGVEDRETLDHLVTIGCDEAQGYYISRPVLAKELTPWLDESIHDRVERK